MERTEHRIERVMVEPEQVKKLVLAGNALITLQSGKTGKHFTYKIKRSKTDDNVYFAYCLYGSDNKNDYKYVGCYFADTKIFHLVKTYKNIVTISCPPSIRAIKFLFKDLDNIHPQLYVYHEGKCARCGRTLTTPESIKRHRSGMREDGLWNLIQS